MSDNNYCVYVHRNKLNNKIYVGMTNNATLRFSGNGTQYKPTNKRDMGYEYVVIYNNQEYVYHTLEDMVNEYFNNQIAISNVARIMKSEKPYKFKKIKQQKYNGIMIEKREV